MSNHSKTQGFLAMLRFHQTLCWWLHGSAAPSQDFSLVAVSIVEVFSQFLVAGPNSAASFDTVANMRAGD
jgi:hypothetical protein